MTKSLMKYLLGPLAFLAATAFAAPATTFKITPLDAAPAAGVPTDVVVDAVDGSGARDLAFTGSVTLGSSDATAILPADYTYVAGDQGRKIFTLTFRKSGSQTVTVSTLPPTTFMSGTSDAIAVNGGTATVLAVTAPATASANLPVNVTVTAKDAYANTANTYTGIVSITSSDPQAVLPASAALAAGTGTFAVTLKTVGPQTVTATGVGPVTGTSGNITVAATPLLTPAPGNLAFGGQSMQTTSPSLAVTISNSGGGPATVTSITAPAHFGVTHNCTTVNPGASCTANVTFTPTAEGALSGNLTITGNAGTQTVALTGTGEKSLVTHYYRSILRRAPDDGGKTFWNAEAARLQALGPNVNEVWFAMAQSFYTSPEYLAFNRNDTEYVTDIYNTFFNRGPDTAGLTYWTGQLASGMPREVALVSFMFSNEFITFTQGIFGNVAVRAEVDMVTDFYRGVLSRLPDDAGFGFWVQKFRIAQCQGAASVNAEAEAISSQFALGAEYTARNRTNSQYVGDLYNAFLRRGGDLTGVLFWIGKLQDGSMTREQLRREFMASPEFQARVAAVIAAGTFPGVTCAPPGTDVDINNNPIPSPTGAAGANMCEFYGQQAPFPGGGPGPCGAYEIPAGNCSSGMTGAEAITKAWQYNLEDYTATSPRNGNSIRVGFPRSHAMVFRFKTGPASSFGSLPTADPNLLRFLTIGMSEQVNRGPSAPRFVTISETRCDFDYSKTLSGGTANGCYMNLTGDGSILGKVWANGIPTTGTDFPFCALKPDTKYYLNIRWEDAGSIANRGRISCPAGVLSCGQAIGFN